MVSVPNYFHKGDTGSDVAICVPVRDNVTAQFAYSLAMLQKKCGETNQTTTLHMNMGSEVAMQRQQLVDQALETSATHILWLDSDMVFPPELLQALLTHKKDIVACNYSTRVKPHRPVAFKSAGNLDKRVHTGTGLEEIFAVGMGCMLVKRSVYENLPKPHFAIEWNEDFSNMVGEDVYFCSKAQDCGYMVWLDNDMSNHIGHIGSKIYTVKGDCND